MSTWNKDWYKSSYRRNLVDMHIEDWDEEFLSRLDPKEYIENLKTAQVKSAMVYTNSHIGLCYWPTPYGKMHKGLGGTDFVKEMTSGCHREGMDVVLYFTVVFDNWAYEQNPDWRIVHSNGIYSRQNPRPATPFGLRYGHCCPNSLGYREYVKNQLQHLTKNYDFEGFFIDMTFWPAICRCEQCIGRYREEVGRDIPVEMDWNNSVWLDFVSKREDWLSEFAHFITRCVKEINPDITVEHQTAQATSNWTFGTNAKMTSASDYIGGDLYGGHMQQSFVCKLYRNLSPNQPFEYMTSRSDPSLRFHTNTKSFEDLSLHNYITAAHHGAFLIIDAIDPSGRMHRSLYETMGKVFESTRMYETYYGGNLVKDVALLFPLDSKIDTSESGKTVDSMMKNNGIGNNAPYATLETAMSMAKALKSKNILYDIITNKDLDHPDCMVLVLPDVYLLSDEDACKIKAFVLGGGSLYVTGMPQNEIIWQLCGLTYLGGSTKEVMTYIRPNEKGRSLLAFEDEYAPITVNGPQYIAKANYPEEVIATITLPYTDPSDGLHVASIHSNPPGRDTDMPAMILRKEGKGRVLWSAGAYEKLYTTDNAKVFLKAIDLLCQGEYAILSDAPYPIEFVMMHQPEKRRYILSVLNMQEQYPLVPVTNTAVWIHLGNKKVKSMLSLPSEMKVVYHGNLTENEGYLKLPIGRIEMFGMYGITYLAEEESQ